MYAAAVLVTAMLGDVVPTPYDLMCAEALVTAPAGSPVYAEPWPRARAAVLTVMVREGAIDPEHFGVMFPFAAGSGWAPEVDNARKNIAAVKHTPPLHHLDRFPPPAVAFKLYELNRDHAARLTARLAWEPDRAARIGAAITESRWLADTWYLVHELGVSRRWERPQRLRLAALRDALGEELWESPDLIPAAATWSFDAR